MKILPIINKLPRATKIQALGLSIFATVIGLSIALYRAALWTNTINFETHPLVQTESTDISFVIVLNRPVVIRKVEALEPVVKVVEVERCEWSRECVERYIDIQCGEDKICASWAKYVSAHEGGYTDQFAQANFNDGHENGKIGSFGQFQFGEDTYARNCEPTKNWKMDWRAQTRCAVKLFHEGSYKSHWLNNTRGWLESLGK